jgi:uncharacterized Tic20 family protein
LPAIFGCLNNSAKNQADFIPKRGKNKMKIRINLSILIIAILMIVTVSIAVILLRQAALISADLSGKNHEAIGALIREVSRFKSP